MKLTLKQEISTLLLCLAFLTGFSQETKTYSIKGTVTDSVVGKGLDFVTVALKTLDGNPVRSAISSGNGDFSIAKVPTGKYRLSLINVGYKTWFKDIELVGDAQVLNLGRLVISPLSGQLKEVTITGDRPLIKQEVDRIAYDVQADPENKVNTVLEMLRKVPLVTIDADDNIQVKGSGSFRVLINGRPSSLVARSPKDVFKSMPASNIQKIEVITTPPAKYDGEGLAGIINIITNKKVDQGYNGSVTTRYNFPYGPGSNVQLTVKGKKLGISSYVGGNLRDLGATSFALARTTLGENSTSLIMNGSRANQGSYMYSNAELSYEIDTLNLVTAELGYNYGDGRNNNSQFMNEYLVGSNSRTSGYNISNPSSYDWNGYDLGLNYQLGFKRNKEQLFTGSYKINSGKDNNSNNFFAYDRFQYDWNLHPNYGQKNNSGTNEQTIQTDYVHPFKKLNVEGGMKLILRNNFSEFEYGTYAGDTKESLYTVDNSRSNNFNYDQNVYSFYNSYHLKLKDWAIKGGLRLERTVVDAYFESVNTPLNTDYNNFIPSLSIQKKFKKSSSVNLGYTQRIQRPNIWELNPFEEQLNDKFIRSGNKDLEPVLNHNFDLNYSWFKKGSLNLGLSYSFANNTIQYVNRVEGNVGRATYENIGKNKNFGFNVNTNQQITKAFNINLNGRLSYVLMDGVIDGVNMQNEGMQGNIYTYLGYKFKNDWRAGVNAGFYSAWITLQGQSNPYYYTSASLSKEFYKKKASVSASVNNPFQKFRNWTNETSSLQFIQSETFQNFYRTFALSLNYKFGKLNGAIKKNQRGIQNDDVAGKSGGN
ncbi:outer membrane beta-barrel family protein [Desertivirga brevis]|uniref:outer membrane beta-barrel family protein n=1 Tax=Desertivirga brevis TaxID=2810310 RepID=UPI001A95C5B2|nr:outer membrane beta-barrel family protein [Pedobacter sp. SYSU D00873]